MSEIADQKSRLERRRLERARERAKAAFTVLLVLFVVKGMLYLIATPPWQAPDETFHYKYGLTMAGEAVADRSHESLIIESMAKWDFWRYQLEVAPDPLPFGFGDIPFFATIGAMERSPLYYKMTAPLLWISEGASIEARLYLLRLINLLMAAGILICTYYMSKLLFPEDRFLQLAPPIFITFLPQFSFISASVTNDIFIDLIFAVFILLAALMIKQGFNWPRAFALLLIFMVAIFAKRSAVIMPAIALLLPYFVVMTRPKRHWGAIATVLAGETIFATAAVMLFKFSHSLRSFIRETLKVHLELSALTGKAQAFVTGGHAWDQFVFNFRTAIESFWAHFGWMNIPLDPWGYWFPWAMLFIAVFGLFLGGKSLAPLFMNRSQVTGVVMFMAVVIMITFIFGLLRTTVYEFVPLQGRYMFPALPAIAVVSAWGVRSFFPRTDSRILLSVFASCMFGFELIALFGFMIPGYYFI